MGVSENMSVAVTALQQTATRLRDEVTTSGMDLTSCSRQMADQHQGWGPAAETASTALQAAWDQADQALLGKLNAISDDLDACARAYTAVDSATAGALSQTQT